MVKNTFITAEPVLCPWCEHEDIYEIWTNSKTDTIIECNNCEKSFVVYLDIRVCINEDETIDQEKKRKRKRWLLE